MNDTNEGSDWDHFEDNNTEVDLSNMKLNEEHQEATSVNSDSDTVPSSVPQHNAAHKLPPSVVSSITGTNHYSVPSAAGPPPMNISCAKKTSREKGSSTKRHHSSKTCSSNSQALLRAKASLTCPTSFRLNTSHTNFCGTMVNRRLSEGAVPALSVNPNVHANVNANMNANSTHATAHTAATPTRRSPRITGSSTSRPLSAPNSIHENLPNHRNFGLTTTSPTPASIRSSNSLCSLASSPSIDNLKKKLTTGEWKDVEVNPNPLEQTARTDIGIFSNNVLYSSSPTARSLHASAVWKDQMFIFGGYDGTSRRNDFYSFHFKHRMWTRIDERVGHAPSQGDSNATENANDAQHLFPNVNINGQVGGQPPSPRDRHSAVVYGNGFYVFGGFDGHARVNDLYKYDIDDNVWSRIIPSSLSTGIPTPRHSHSAVVYQNAMYIFGGYDGSYSCNVYKYDFLNNVWTSVNTVGRIPRARYRASCVVYNDTMIIHGGHDGTRHLSDTHVLDMNTKCWTSLANVRGTTPFPRDSQVGFLHDNAMYIFGGSAGGTAMNDMHELLLEGPENDFIPMWRKVFCGGTTSPRFCHVGALFEDNLYVFGGYDGQSRLDDFVRFQFNVDDLSYEVPPSTILSDLHSFVNNEALSDITFIIEGQPIHAHKMMLVRSPYFRAMFSGSMMESQQSEIHIEEMQPHIFLMILGYLYTDHLDIHADYAMEIFAAADLFDIPRLQAMCEKCMLKTIHIENAATIFLTADHHSVKSLRAKALKYILKHFELVSRSAAFEEMARSNVELVVEILRER